MTQKWQEHRVKINVGKPQPKAPRTRQIEQEAKDAAETRRRWREATAGPIEARSVVETDAWGVKRVVGGFGDVGGPGKC